jgi:putative hydrolase of the HAD superfamily
MDEHELFLDLIRDSAARAWETPSELRLSSEPQVPALPSRLEGLAGSFSGASYKAVLFDVYGTLFCSAAGDIASAVRPSESPADSAALDAVAALYDPCLSGGVLRAFFNQQVADTHHQLRAQTQWPEVQADRIWEEFLRQRGLAGSGRELALRYELALNPVYPMPGAGKTIAALRESGCTLGIISNAQFYTPLLFEAFLGGAPEDIGFDRELILYSYEYGEAKPSPRLFETAANRLKSRGINPSDCAFVGNDMLSDILGAHNAGFQGILFAGDNRSLRIREDNTAVRRLCPGGIIRRLSQLVNPASPIPAP